jgi:hypothetical protein
MLEPINRTILVTDVERFSRRVDGDQGVIRRVIRGVLQKTLEAASIDLAEYRKEDRGDGQFVLVDPSVPKPQLIRALMSVVPTELREYNRRASEVAQVRMRCVLHAGEVAIDEDGAVGGAVVEAFRLCAAEELKGELAKSIEPAIFCVSDHVYDTVVRHHHPGIPPERFHPKELGDFKGWVYDETRSRTADADADPTAESARIEAIPAAAGPDRLTAAPGVGNQFTGTTHIAGDAVGGNKFVLGPERRTDRD